MHKTLSTALIAAVALAVGAPAQGQNVHWSATLTAEEHFFPDGAGPYIGFGKGLYGELSDGEFEYGGVAYLVPAFYITNDPRSLLVTTISLDDNRAPLQDDTLTFRVDGETFALSDVDRVLGGNTFAWDNSGLDWSDGDTVTVELIGGITPVPALPLAGVLALGALLYGLVRRRQRR